MNVDRSCFPSGRSVGNCRHDAKRLAKAENIPLHAAQDRIALANGASLPWHKAIAAIAAGTLTSAPSGHESSLIRKKVTPADISAAIKKFPHLTHFGMGASRIPPESSFRAELERGQQQLLDALDEVERCCQFLEHVEKRKTIDTGGLSSYGLKHHVEVFHRARLDPPENAYVSNGSFICAAVIMGFEVLQPPRGGPNVWFNMSRRSAVFEWRRAHDSRVRRTPEQNARQAALAQTLGVHFQSGSYLSNRFTPRPSPSASLD